MSNKMMSTHDLHCPNCHTEIDPDTLQQLCFEPYNGIYFECDDCKHGYSLNIYVEAQLISEPETDDE